VHVSTLNATQNLDLRRIGGLGVPLILRLAENASHTMLETGNRITLVFRPR
jgi:hypothetical protein